MISRRSALKTIASVTMLGGAAFGGLAVAKGAGTATRYDARSPRGRDMLALYAKGVKEMRSSALAGTPSDWVFQWYTHAVRSDSDKTTEIDSMYPNPTDPNRLLALTVWDTCSAHHPGTEGFDFLPWHRAYVLVFEHIVRKACGDESFTLPYWDYTDDAAIPEPFRNGADPEFAPLFIADRNAGVNDGVPMDQIEGVWHPEYLNLNAMREAAYLPGPEGVPQGMNEKLDRELHSFVHVNVGTPTNMGTVPFAANDPVFWIHHCNIDRIWAGWNKNGGLNPSDSAWRGRTHVFADASGEFQRYTNGQVSDTSDLGYQYETLPSVDMPAVALTASGPAATEAPENLARSGPISLGAEPQRVSLARPLTATADPLEASAPSGRRRYLVLEDVRAADGAPGILYHVVATRVDDTGASDASPPEELYIGSLTFFDAVIRPVRFVYDVTEALAGVENLDPLEYVIVPGGTPQQGATPVVGSITLVER